MVRKILIILLLSTLGYSIIELMQDDSQLLVVEVDESEITVNDSSDIEEYMLGLKP